MPGQLPSPVNDLVIWASRVIAKVQYKPGWSVTLLEQTAESGEKNVFLQCVFQAPDVDAPDSPPTAQYGRRWALWPGMTETELVETAFKAIMTAENHEVGEWFRYEGEQVFSPHFDIQARLALCREGKFDHREDGSTFNDV